MNVDMLTRNIRHNYPLRGCIRVKKRDVMDVLAING